MDYLSKMPKGKDTKRIEIHLLPDVVKKLQKLADKENRSLKNFCETKLIEAAEPINATIGLAQSEPAPK